MNGHGIHAGIARTKIERKKESVREVQASVTHHFGRIRVPKRSLCISTAELAIIVEIRVDCGRHLVIRC